MPKRRQCNLYLHGIITQKQNPLIHLVVEDGAEIYKLNKL